MDWIISLVVNAVVVLGVAYMLPKVEVRNFGSALLVALLIGILNPTIGWLLRGVLHVATLGIPALLGLGFIIRLIAFAIIIKMVDALVGGFKVHGFTTALIMALILAVVGSVVNHFLDPADEADGRALLNSVSYLLPIA